MNHSLTDMDPPAGGLRSTNEDSIAPYALEQEAVSETNVRYRGQVAVNNGSRKTQEDDITKRDVGRFSQEVMLRGVLVLSDKVVIIDNGNNKLKLFEQSGKFLSCTDLKEFATGITLVDREKFATCGSGNKVLKWLLRADTIIGVDETYDVEDWADGMHYNGTYYCVLHQVHHTVTILDRGGRRVRKIVKKQVRGQDIEFGYDIHIDIDTHNIYTACWPPNSGILCMSVEGTFLWFTPLSNTMLRGMAELPGKLCAADSKSCCLHVISKTGQYKGRLLCEESMSGKPFFTSYSKHNKELYVTCRRCDEEASVAIYSLQ